MKLKFNEIKQWQEQPKEPLRDWASRGVERRRRPTPTTPDYNEERIIRGRELFDGMY
jgi:hypothetical protein